MRQRPPHGKGPALLPLFGAMLLGLAVAACMRLIPDPNYSGGRPTATAPDFNMTSCTRSLDARGVAYRSLPDEDHGGQCRMVNAVKLTHIGMPTSNLGPMTCRLADRFSAWIVADVESAARRHFGARLAGIDSYGTYACRNIAGSGTVSEHARANAVDVAGFRLSNGQRITVLSDWNARGPQGAFLRDIAKSACARFGTVLGPDYNEAHRDHIHLDMADRRSGSYCR